MANHKNNKGSKKKNLKKLRKVSISGDLHQFNKMDPFPPTKNMTVTYAGADQLTTANGITNDFGSELSFQLNAPADPLFGTSPAVLNKTANGMDEIALLYHRMKVNAVSVEVEFYDPSLAGIVCGALVKNPSNAGEVLQTSPIGIVEARPYAWTQFISDTGNQRTVFRMYAKMSKLWNLTELQYKTDIVNTTSTTTAVPATPVYLALAVSDSLGSSTSKTCQFTIKIHYYCQFYQRFPLTRPAA